MASSWAAAFLLVGADVQLAPITKEPSSSLEGLYPYLSLDPLLQALVINRVIERELGRKFSNELGQRAREVFLQRAFCHVIAKLSYLEPQELDSVIFGEIGARFEREERHILVNWIDEARQMMSAQELAFDAPAFEG